VGGGPRFQDLLPEGVAFRRGAVQSVDLQDHCVFLAEGQTLEYDALVLALGGETPLQGVPGAAEFAFPFRTLADAQRLRAHLQTLEARDPAQAIYLAIVGGGGQRRRASLQIGRPAGLARPDPSY
jgi:NADH:ubiquinone reductase (non-electrogenic)